MEDHSPEFQLFLSIFSRFMAFPRCVPNVHHFVASKPVLVWQSCQSLFTHSSFGMAFIFAVIAVLNSSSGLYQDYKINSIQHLWLFIRKNIWIKCHYSVHIYLASYVRRYAPSEKNSDFLKHFPRQHHIVKNCENTMMLSQTVDS